MKRTKNRILSVFLSFCMIISCMAGINVTAGAEPNISYLDADGAEQTCSNYIVVTEATTQLTDGNWYVVNSDVTLTSNGLYVVRNANLILCDGAKLTVNGGIGCLEDGNFTIYAQSTGGNMGKLIATYGEDPFGIGNTGGNRTITINGGDIQATGSPTNTGGSDTGIYNGGNPVIINGGKVTASGYDKGIHAKNVTINGGEVVASGNDYGIYVANGLTINGGEVIASSTRFSAIRGNLTVADGLTVFGDDSADPTTVRTDYAETRWKYMTVKKIPPEPVSYLDKNGVEQTCTDYIAIKEAIGELTDGNWYVVNSDVPVTVDNVLFVDGDVNLILCDGAKLTVNGGIRCYNDGGFTIYAQSTGENMGKLIATYGGDYAYGIGNTGGNRTITINGGDIQATGSPTNTISALAPDAGIYNGGNPVIINGGKVTASGFDYGIFAESVTINGGEVIASGNGDGIYAKSVTINGGEVTVSSNYYGINVTNGVTINGGEVVASSTVGKAIDGNLTVADGLTVFGDDSADPTTVRTDYATTRWKYMTVKAAKLYSVTLTGGANATPDPADGVSQTNIYGDMKTVVYTANPGYYFEEFADITVNGITATRIDAETVRVYGTPTGDVVFTVPDAKAPFSSTVKVVWSEIGVKPEKLTATLAGVDSYTLNAENSWSNTVTGLTQANNNWSIIDCPVGYSFSSSTVDTVTTFTFTFIPMPSPESVTADSITLEEVTGYEYSKDNGETWQDSPTFMGLAPGTEYTFVQRPKGTAFKSRTNVFCIEAFYVKFNVVNGKWDDGTNAEKTVVLVRTTNEDLVLTLKSSDIPAVGSNPDNGYKAGSWDTVPTTEAEVSADKTFTYTYAEKTTPTITAVPTASAIKYGKTLADSKLTGGAADVDGTFAWTTKTIAPAVADSNTTKYDVTFTPEDTDNYTTAACKVKLTVNKAEPTITTAPTASAITYGQTLADSKLSGGAADVDGTFAWTTKTTAPAVADSNTTEYDVTFTPTDKDNYTTAACKVKLTVGKADQAAPAVTAVAETIKGKADGKITGVNATMEYRADGEATYTAITGTEITGLAAGTYKVRYKETETQTASPDTDAVVNSGSKITVTFDTNGGSRIPETQEHTYREKAVKPADNPIKTGHTFRFWSLDGTAEYDFETELTANITLKAVYYVNHYTITVIRGIADKTTAEAGEIVRIQADYLMNMCFCYWNSDVVVKFENIRGKTTTFKMPASDVEITANFTRITPIIPETSGGSSTSISPSPAWTEPSKDTEADIPKLSITGVQDARNQSALSWNNVPGATNYSLYVKVGGKYAFVQDLGTATNADIVLGANGKYYVSTGGNYKIYTYVKKTGTFKNTGTLEAWKIDHVVKANNVTNNFMIKYKVNGKESAEKDSYKVSVKIYYRPAPKATFKDGKVTIKWAKVEGATMYRVMKKTSSGYELVTETEKNSVRISNVKSGKYTYAVQALVDGKWTKVYKNDLASVTVE